MTEWTCTPAFQNYRSLDAWKREWGLGLLWGSESSFTPPHLPHHPWSPGASQRQRRLPNPILSQEEAMEGLREGPRLRGAAFPGLVTGGLVGPESRQWGQNWWPVSSAGQLDNCQGSTGMRTGPECWQRWLEKGQRPKHTTTITETITSAHIPCTSRQDARKPLLPGKGRGDWIILPDLLKSHWIELRETCNWRDLTDCCWAARG